MRSTFKLFVFAFATLLVMQAAARAEGCTQIMGNPESKEGIAVCDGNSVEIGGKIKDVSTQTPVGGKNGFFQKAGSDGEAAVRGAGQGIEHGAHELGKVFSNAFGW
jgi:hypothetical protein